MERRLYSGKYPDSSNENSPLLIESTRPLCLRTRIAYGMGHILNDICAALWFSYMMLFLQVDLGMSPLLAGSMMFIGQVVDGLATPVIGILADRIGTKGAWHMAGSILVITSFPLIFRSCPSCPIIFENTYSSRAILTAFTYALLVAVFQIGWAAVQITHLALIPELTPNQKGRNNLTAFRFTASVCASVTVYLITYNEFRVLSQQNFNPEEEYKFKNIVLYGIAIGIVTTLWFHIGLRKQLSNNLSVATSTNTRTLSLGYYFQKPLLFQVAFLYVASRLFVTLSLIYMPLYLHERLDCNPDGVKTLALVPLTSYVASFLASLIVARFVHGPSINEIAYLFGTIISLLGCLWISLSKDPNFGNQIYGVAILMGAGSSVTLVSSLCLAAEFIGSRTGNGGFVYSVVTFADKLFTGLAVILIEKSKNLIKVNYFNFYCDVLAYVCGITTLIGLMTLGTLFITQMRRRSSEQKPGEPL